MRVTISSAASLLAGALLLAGCTCSPAARTAAPEIPLPAPTELPRVTVPRAGPDGRLCFTPEDVRRLRDGIQALKAENAALRELIRRYDGWRSQ